MMVNIKVIGDEPENYSEEYEAACLMKDYMDSFFNEHHAASGEIDIVPSYQVPGGSVHDIDILVVGKLENCILNNFYCTREHPQLKDLEVNGFCVTVELKQHPIDNVRVSMGHTGVKYNSGWKDATDQSIKQKWSVAKYLTDKLRYIVIVGNLLWMQGLTADEVEKKTQGDHIGLLPSRFTFESFVYELAVNLASLIRFNKNTDRYSINGSFNEEPFLYDIRKKIIDDPIVPHGLTMRKLTLLSSQLADKENDKIRNTNSIVMQGRAGTGKTLRLIELAIRQAVYNGSRCLILTYNHALVSDIRRLLFFMKLPDSLDGSTVAIETKDSFFLKLSGILLPNTWNLNNDYDQSYGDMLSALLSEVEKRIQQTDKQYLTEDSDSSIDFDKIYVDEGQDWSNKEQSILTGIYGQPNIVVADGIDQFVTGNQRLIWPGEKIQIPEVSLRQKANLSRFANAFAAEMGLTWRVDPNDHLPGGHVIITNKYKASLHKKLLTHCSDDGCENYDMLFLCPPQMVKDGAFKKIELWKKNGIYLFDGTSTNNRGYYSVNEDECRLYQYNSCRGLEGWAVICMWFDKLVEYRNSLPTQSQPLRLESPEVTKQREIALWLMMPMTRAIDTLVIQVENTESDIMRKLLSVREKCKDYTTVIVE